MKQHTSSRHLFGLRTSGAAAAVAVASAGLLVGMAGAAQAATMIGLGTASSFVVLAGAGVTNTGPTTLNGDIGTFPTTSISGAGSLTVNGTNHAGDGVTQGAKTDLVTAYDTAAGEASNVTVSADLAGQTLTGGVYTSASSMGLSGALTLDASGNPDSVFVFQIGSALTIGSGAEVLLIGGAQACNVFWVVGSSATVGTGAAFRGNVLALTSITLTTGATLEGRALARNGAVTLDTNVITAPVCTTPPGTSVPYVSAATVPSAGTPVTTPQVRRAPRGGVQTGDGSTVGQPGDTPRRVPLPLPTELVRSPFVPTQWCTQS